jgi:hypothetical protein
MRQRWRWWVVMLRKPGGMAVAGGTKNTLADNDNVHGPGERPRHLISL